MQLNKVYYSSISINDLGQNMKEVSNKELSRVHGGSANGYGVALGAAIGVVAGPPGILIGGLIGAMLGTIGGAYAYFETQ
jgi:uncharacterized membrane protein